MSASLKEQLQALSLEGSTPKPEENKNKHHTRKPAAQPSTGKQKPVWLEYAQYGVELLRAHYPDCFKDIKDIKPLKVGIKQDLVKQLSSRDDIVVSDKGCMVNSLAYYVNSTAYHKSVIEGAVRIDLSGNEAGTVTAEEARYSQERCQTKLRKIKSSKVRQESVPE